MGEGEDNRADVSDLSVLCDERAGKGAGVARCVPYVWRGREVEYTMRTQRTGRERERERGIRGRHERTGGGICILLHAHGEQAPPNQEQGNKRKDRDKATAQEGPGR